MQFKVFYYSLTTLNATYIYKHYQTLIQIWAPKLGFDNLFIIQLFQTLVLISLNIYFYLSGFQNIWKSWIWIPNFIWFFYPTWHCQVLTSLCFYQLAFPLKVFTWHSQVFTRFSTTASKESDGWFCVFPLSHHKPMQIDLSQNNYHHPQPHHQNHRRNW